MSGYYAKNPHYSPDPDPIEYEHEAGQWFWPLVDRQKAIYDMSMALAKCDADRIAARAQWDEDTSDARKVYDLALGDLWRFGKITDATRNAYEALEVAL